MQNDILEQVQARYGAVALSQLSGKDTGVKAVAEAFGYTAEELASIPAEANMGLSCGNPTAHASLRPGETVVDLGCGGGLDVFLSAQKVGPTGKAIGIDMTPAMLERARQNAVRQGLANVEFHLTTIDRMPLQDASVDCIISNCVINLAPDKPAVFREMYRVLKPGGRVAVSDIALKKSLPDELKGNMAAYVGCVAGAITMAEYAKWLQEAGFGAVQVIDKQKDLNAYAKAENQSGCCSPTLSDHVEPSCCSSSSTGSQVHDSLASLLRQFDVNAYAASIQVLAVKIA
jgi:arsenite methyltransferase